MIEYLKGGFLLIYWSFLKPISIQEKLGLTANSFYVKSGNSFSLILQGAISSALVLIPTISIFGLYYNWLIVDDFIHNGFFIEGYYFQWGDAIKGVLVGCGMGILLGLSSILLIGDKSSSLVSSIAFGNSLGLFFGVIAGTAGSSSNSVWVILILGSIFSISIGSAFGVVFDIRRAIMSSFLLGLVNGGVMWLLGMIALPENYHLKGLSGVGTMISEIYFTVGFILCLCGGVRIYFWIPELIWSLGLGLYGFLFKSIPALDFLPTRFDERILFPLPFLKDFIVRNYARNSETTLNYITYLTNSTNQQKLAANCRINIVLDCLNRGKSFTEITTISDEFNWLPSPLPSEYKFDSAITELLEISKDIRSVDLATSPYRAVELLRQPTNRLEDVQKNLAFSKSRHRPTLGQITQRWLSILATAKENYQAQAANSLEIPPAYIAGNSLAPANANERFKGRADIFREIENISLSPSPPVLLLYGGRRTGKTSSLKYLPRKVDSSLVPLLVDLQGTATSNQLSSFAKAFATQIIDFARTNHNLTIHPPDPKRLETDPISTLQDWLADIETLKPHARFLLCLDEYERLSEVIAETGSKAPLNFLRSTMQNRKRWILLFSGSHTLEELEPYWSDTLINAQSIRMSYLQKSEAVDLIRQPVSDFPDIYTDAAVERILYWTSCQPYLVQMIGTVLVDTLNIEQPEPRNYKVSADDIDGIIPKVIERANGYFNELWRLTITSQQQEILTQFMREGHLEGVAKVEINRLIFKEILQRDNGEFSFQVPITEKYLRAQVE